MSGSFRDYRKGANGRQRAKVLPAPFIHRGEPRAKSRSTSSALQEAGLGGRAGPNSLPPFALLQPFPTSSVGEVAREAMDTLQLPGALLLYKECSKTQQLPKGERTITVRKREKGGGGWGPVGGERPRQQPMAFSSEGVVSGGAQRALLTGE